MDERPLIAAGDRISALPDEILHNILYRLDDPGQVARTSSLSRRWLHLWRTYPVLEVDYQSYTKFAGFSAASARRITLYYENCKAPLDSLRLSLEILHPSILRFTSKDDVRTLLAAALGGGYGSPLDIAIRFGIDCSYSFPAGSFSNCGRTKTLKLRGCDLSGVGTVSLLSLRVLDLEYVDLTQQFLHNVVVDNAPNLESLTLTRCPGLKRLEVAVRNFPKLQTLHIDSGSRWELQLTAAPFLQSLVIHVDKSFKLKAASSASAPNLRCLVISSLFKQFARPDHEEFISKLPSLEILKLSGVCLSDEYLRSLMDKAPLLRTVRCKHLPLKEMVEISGHESVEDDDNDDEEVSYIFRMVL
ncbi:unnamed protein product [Linum trigynum]|uniref:F-box domain-containing protein n=1 Tax=Linum trigynum TaxID=586398 RepID=A0AAV2E1X7_9ROSI